MILLACAVDRELAGFDAPRGVETLVTGVGPVEAASAVARALAGGSYDLVLSGGIAGAFDGAAAVGEGVALAEDAIELSLEDGRAIALPGGARVVDRVRSDPALVGALRARGIPVLCGITVARVTATEATAARLAKLAPVETMEGFAVLRAAQRAGVAALGVRGISNRAGARERSGWDFDAGAAGLRRVLRAVFEIVDASRATA